MRIISFFYIVNVTLLLLHEIESAYEKEWEILRLPGKITGFLILHIPFIFIFMYGLLEVERQSSVGFFIGMVSGICGIIPFLVHKLFVKRDNCFNLPISNLIIYLNILSGLAVLSLSLFFYR